MYIAATDLTTESPPVRKMSSLFQWTHVDFLPGWTVDPEMLDYEGRDDTARWGNR